MDEQLIILSVPHAKCLSENSKHTCDTAADKLATYIKNKLKNKDARIFLGDINRSIIDLNREAGIYTSWRKNIRDTIKNKLINYKLNKSNIVFVLDCHSFPNGSFGTKKYPNPDVSILYSSKSQLNIINKLINTFERNNIVTTSHLGIHNSVIDEFYILDQRIYNVLLNNYVRIIPILIEVKESITEDQLDKIGLCVNEWIDNITHSLINQ